MKKFDKRREGRKPFFWSYSSLSTYETCALKYKYRKEKIPTRPNKYLENGIKVHKLGESYLKGTIRKIPEEYAQFKDPIKELRSEQAQSEVELAFTRKWELTGWWDDPWLRIKIDALIGVEHSLEGVATIIDFKTGRPKEYPDQERLYKTGVLAAYPEVNKALVQFWYLDHGIVLPKSPVVVSRKNFLAGAQKEFEIRAGRMEKEKKFAPTPGGHCSYCDYSNRKGGPCKF